MKPTLNWSIKAGDASLKLTINVENTLATPIHVCDRLVTDKAGKRVATDNITVMNDDEPKTVKFALASISADEPSTVLYTPSFKRVASGATYTRVINVPVPLKAWHPVAGVMPVRGDATFAVLLVHYFTNEPSRFEELSDGTKTPVDPEYQILRSTPVSLPK